MRADEIAALMVAGMQQQANGNSNIGWHTGVIESWDDLTGLNSVRINGNIFSNLPLLASNNTVRIEEGEVVGIIRVGTQYFVLGAVRAAGRGAGLRLATARVGTSESTSSTSWTDLATVGPDVTTYCNGRVQMTYGGMILCDASGAQSKTGGISVEVTGPTSVGPTAFDPAQLAAVNVYSAASVMVTDTIELPPGQYRFRLKYISANGNNIQFQSRRLTVMPY
ncbi:hypothetical protein [Amycolatopsis viridis]|uniref:DUF5689 domain-containing protein n=1 Tax=Amycolatopsis viridis TaxID=185678 RepID=A0ABX0SXJ5_9PSEU|nr:hypothetical protein [Amycolatopsis viridis]NIH81683.1 hypothetical protein [Amycolatopsis viridis]